MSAIGRCPSMVDRFEAGDPTALIRTGDEIRIEPDKGLVTILNRDTRISTLRRDATGPLSPCFFSMGRGLG